MPRASSKRKSTAPKIPSPANSSSNSNARSGKAKAKAKEVENLFDKYANGGIIDPDGIMTFCKDLGMEYTDVRILMLAWKLKSTKLGFFTQDEWQTGLKTLQVDNLSKLKKAISELEKEVRTPPNFADFYAFAFRYHLTEERQKNIDIDTICELLNLVLGPQFRRQVDLLIDYLKVQSTYKVINMDQWLGIFRFCNEISFTDLQNYDETLAWPLILDDFVDWLRENPR